MWRGSDAATRIAVTNTVAVADVGALSHTHP